MAKNRIEWQIEGGFVVCCGHCEHQDYRLTHDDAEAKLTEHLVEYHGYCPIKFEDKPCTYFEDRTADNILNAEVIE